MASVTLAPDLESLALAHAASAHWWHRGHSYAFIALVVAEVFVTWGVVRLAEEVVNGPPGLEFIASAAMIGFLFAQCFLLGLWAALGGLPTVARWLLVGLVACAGSLAVADLLASDWNEFINQGPIMALLAGLVMAGFAVVLLPLRRLAGWRVDFDAAYHPRTGVRRGQLELMDFAAMFCAVALPLTLCRSLVEIMGDVGDGVGWLVPMIGAIVFATAGPVAYAVLARRGTWYALAFCAVCLVIVCVAQSALAAQFPAFDLFRVRGGAYLLNRAAVVAFHLGVAAAVAMPLVVLRWCGLQLISVK